MPIRVDKHLLEKSGRPAGIATALFTLRSMELWKRDVDDYDRAMILIAVVVITAERLLRTELDPDDRPLGKAIDPAKLRKCNISSIAHATGLNRETTRRKVNELIEHGWLTRLEDGTVGFRPGLVQEAQTRDVISAQVSEIATVANQLLKIGVLAET